MYKPQPNLMILKPKSEAMLGKHSAEKRFVSKIEYPKDGGILSYFNNERFPEKQLVYPEIFGFLNPFKRSLIFFLNISKGFVGKIFLSTFIICLANKKFRRLAFIRYVEMFWTGWHVVGIEDSYFCPSARELLRVSLSFVEDNRSCGNCGACKNCEDYIVKTRFCSMVAAFLECDNAYRYRMQDFFGILDKDNFLKKPRAEFNRAIKEFGRREQLGKEWLGGKINGLVSVFNFILLFPRYKTLITSFIAELDFEKVRLDLGDRYWCYHRTDYNADGLDLIDRMRRRSLMRL